MVGVESLESHGAHPQAGGMGRTEESGRFSVASGKAGDLGKALQDVRNDGVALAGDDAQCVAGVALGLFVVTLRNLDARASSAQPTSNSPSRSTRHHLPSRVPR
ncbi:MAG TPA: hypothetical protein VF874_13075 [Mycobacterium sp.]|jgi:hypothetical protein